MDKNTIKNIETSSQTTNHQEHQEHRSRGVYLRDDHCDWGSSGMNEFTEEYNEKEKELVFLKGEQCQPRKSRTS